MDQGKQAIFLTLPTSALLRTLSATASGCFLHGDDMPRDRGMEKKGS